MLAIGDVVVNKADNISELVKLTFYRFHRKLMLHSSTLSSQAKTPIIMIVYSPKSFNDDRKTKWKLLDLKSCH